MRLNNRLKMIADNIPPCTTVSDIGTDHAYIPIYAVQNGLCEKALAADLRSGPLEMANKNIKRNGLETHVETRLGNGLEPILPSECDVIVIAGMGGQLIRDILSASGEKAQRARLLLLQPNNAPDALRRWLYENGYAIVDEALALDAGKYYCLISAQWTGEAVEKDLFTYYIGEKLFEKKDPLLPQYIRKKLRELEVVIEGRSRADVDKLKDREGMAEWSSEACLYIRTRMNEYLEQEQR